MWPGATSTSGGSNSRHAAKARGQRETNRHPAGTVRGDGGSPRVAGARSPLRVRVDGWACSSARVYGCLGSRLTIGELFDLRELAADSAEDGVYEFLFVAPALKVTGGAGTPVNPLAIK
jgi:hypothetical protein